MEILLKNYNNLIIEIDSDQFSSYCTYYGGTCTVCTYIHTCTKIYDCVTALLNDAKLCLMYKIIMFI